MSAIFEQLVHTIGRYEARFGEHAENYVHKNGLAWQRDGNNNWRIFHNGQVLIKNNLNQLLEGLKELPKFHKDFADFLKDAPEKVKEAVEKIEKIIEQGHS